ncbi:MAG: hypothetical protein KC419_01875 [Anaerolineales bacterium]|nr:hypothetical protein [Anaerolineales bacterium]MCA9927189.1 hypothetical protein [Anaerolineales bacterium]
MSNRQEILELLSQGKISAEEAADLLGKSTTPPSAHDVEIEVADEEETAVPEKQPFAFDKPTENGKAPSWFRVRVRNMETGKNKVSVNIPLRMFKFGLKLGRKFTDELDDLNWDEIDGMMTNMQTGMIVEVEDEDSNEHVQVFLE